MLWQVDIYSLPEQPDLAATHVAAAARDLGLASGDELAVVAMRGYLIEGDLTADQVSRIARELLVDSVVEGWRISPAGDAALAEPPAIKAAAAPSLSSSSSASPSRLVHVLAKSGVMDPVAESAKSAIADMGLPMAAVRTFRKYWFGGVSEATLAALCGKLLANDAIERMARGPLEITSLDVGAPYAFRRVELPLAELDEAGLLRLSVSGQLHLTLAEMRAVQAYYRELGREPTDIELETIAQTWSEHCSHKTLAGRIAYRDPQGERQFDNMLKQTIFAATVEIRRQLGADDWCVSVFKDNAGVVRFDDRHNLTFKVETHNHPSALEPYGGANTGLGGVIRDTLGVGRGAKPICNTDVFCFAPPDAPADALPAGVLHPRRVMRGVVSGVRDYGNRMGIPTVNGAVFFDPRYLGNPLVYCGSVGILPDEYSFKQPQPGDHIVALGGRTGRDGIHGATFSSVELTTESESLSGGAVQIGNAITEKMVLDVLLAARDRRLFNAVTDCGAGGFSSAVGEMGEEIGAVVWLERAPLKYEGLTYTEIWISEAQERMVLSVSPEHWNELEALCRSEGVEATIIGSFEPTGRLKLLYHGQQVADLSMEFLHDGRPPVVREASYEPPTLRPLGPADRPHANFSGSFDATHTLKSILGSLNVASKEWIIRQYDHEVQGASVLKPLVGVANDGPGDAAVLRPLTDSPRGVVVGCGMNPRLGDFDTARMAESAIDEAVRNCVSVGADPARICLLDNFCWGNCERPETLGSLVRAAIACHDAAVALGMPFVSGKDSLNNEFRHVVPGGASRVIAIPPSLLISAMGQMADVSKAVSMDIKEPGNLIVIVGLTRDELGGSHYGAGRSARGGRAAELRRAHG